MICLCINFIEMKLNVLLATTVDFIQAFDSAPHEHLLLKLNSFTGSYYPGQDHILLIGNMQSMVADQWRVF